MLAKYLALITLLSTSVFAGESVHLVTCANCVRGGCGSYSNEMAYYSDDSLAVNNKQPTDVTQVGQDASFRWEGRSVTGTYKTGVKFTSNIVSNGQSLSTGQYAGTGSNGSKFTCYKDNNRFIYVSSINGGSCQSTYYCLK